MPFTFRHSRTVLALPMIVGLAGAVPIAFPSIANAEGQTAGQKLDDATITAEVKSRILADETSRGININVDTTNGIVTLRGTAPTDAAKQRAEAIAEDVDGVKDVNNALLTGDPSVNPQTATAKTREAAQDGAAAASDSWITTKVKTQLLADDDVEGSDINVTTTGGVVMLSGVVPTESVRKEAAEIASKVDGVKKVDTTQLMVK